MADHSKLIVEARQLADKLDRANLHLIACRTDATMIRALVKIVQAYDTQPSFDKNLKALKAALDRLERRIGCQVVNEELLAACRTSNEAIRAFIGNWDVHLIDKRPSTEDWIKLDAARHLAKRAVEEADKLKGGA